LPETTRYRCRSCGETFDELQGEHGGHVVVGEMDDLCGPLVSMRVDASNLDGELRPSLAMFAAEMENRLRANDHKAGWWDCPDEPLVAKLMEEVAELLAALAGKEPIKRIVSEAADVANIALMLGDPERLAGDPAIVAAAMERNGYAAAE
jgi:hypothetical protein